MKTEVEKGTQLGEMVWRGYRGGLNRKETEDMQVTNLNAMLKDCKNLVSIN